MKKLLGIGLFLVLALTTTACLILFARGYRINFKERSLEATGIVIIKSKPSDAQVSINNESKGTTDLDITNLKPGKYTIKITKEGFSSWSKEVEVIKEGVNLIEASLFPISPNLSSLTYSGVSNPLSSPDMKRIIFSVSSASDNTQNGIWSLDLVNRPTLIFFSSEDLIKIASDTKDIYFSKSSYEFSPNGKQILVKTDNPLKYFLLDPSKENKSPKEITSSFEKIKEGWNKTADSESKKHLKNLGKEAEATAVDLTSLIFSPDKTKFIGTRTDNSVFIFNGKPNPPKQNPETFLLPASNRYIWHSDNKHVILVNKDLISVIEIDGTNNTPIYTGIFDPNFVIPWPDGSKIIIVNNLNSATNKLPNLYAIELH